MSKHNIVAIFDDSAHAEQAVKDVEKLGVPSSNITLLPAGDRAGDYASRGDQEKGFWASLSDLFGGAEDRDTYAEGLRRGGTMVSVRAEDAHLDHIVDILEANGSVDIDERESTWRKEGWTGGVGAGASDAAAVGRRDLGRDDPGMTAMGGGAPRADARALGTDRTATGPAPVTGGARGAGEEVVQLVEERLAVGKRAVNRGKVKVRTRVVSRDVSEDVALHGEAVQVERRPVDRPVSAAALDADPFKERTIEMEQYDEEAVVSKTAHVVEEIGIRKDGVDRVETVHDTLRKTEVDIDDGRTGNMVSSAAGRFASEIRDDMEVVGSDGRHVGTVDHMDGSRIKLKKADVAAGGEHHYLPQDMVGSVAGKVMLAVTAAEAKARWAKG